MSIYQTTAYLPTSVPNFGSQCYFLLNIQQRQDAVNNSPFERHGTCIFSAACPSLLCISSGESRASISAVLLLWQGVSPLKLVWRHPTAYVEAGGNLLIKFFTYNLFAQLLLEGLLGTSQDARQYVDSMSVEAMAFATANAQLA